MGSATRSMQAVVLDDCPMTNLITVEALAQLPGCDARDFTVPAEALAHLEAETEGVGVILTDYEMPGMDGISFVRAVRSMPGLAHVPVVMVTSHGERSLRRQALEAGATDFLVKPIDPFEVRVRVENLLALARAHLVQREHSACLAGEVAAAVEAVEQRELEIISILMRAAEQRDNDTGDHIARVAAYVRIAAEGLGLPPDECRRLSLASTMHDVGKIGTRDAILLKRGPLTDDERREMELHAERGRRILGGSRADVVRLAAEIAGSHHERWDGAGYPERLAGEAIPLSGRIVAVADVFDALTSERPYKEAWPPERARDHLAANAGRHFDPRVVEAFVGRWDDVLAVLRQGAPAPA